MSKITLIILSIVAFTAIVSADSACHPAITKYIEKYNEKHESAYNLLEIDACMPQDAEGKTLRFSFIMQNQDGKYVSCLGVEARHGEITDEGVCY